MKNLLNKLIIVGAALMVALLVIPDYTQGAEPACQWGGCPGVECEGGSYYCATILCCDEVPCVPGEEWEFDCNQSWNW